MARTVIGSKQLGSGIIKNEHLGEDLKIPEKNLQLEHPSHSHANKSALDFLTNSDPNNMKNFDIYTALLVVQDVINARDTGLSLADTVKNRADKALFDKLLEDINSAKGDYGTVAELISGIYRTIDLSIKNHSGSNSHGEIDKIVAEVKKSRGIYNSLPERLENITIGSGGSSGGETSSSEPWIAKVIVPAGETIIETPNSFKLDSNALFVFEGPLLLTPGEENDYIELDNKTIELKYPLDEDTEFRFIGVDNNSLYEWTFNLKSTENQRVVNTMFSYVPNMNQLLVYEDGLLLNSGIDYIETDEYSIEMTQELPTGCNISISKRRIH